MRIAVLSILLTMTFVAEAQQEKRAAARGNSAYESEQYDKAMERYEEALELKENYYEGGFNLGNTLHRKAANMAKQAQEIEDPELQKKLVEESGVLNEQAANRFEMMADAAESKTEKAKAYHNMGNAKLMSGDLEGSIESYKKALRNNPDDNETRYNLAYAQQLKKQQEEQQQEQQQDQEQEQEEEKDQENQEQNEQEKNQEQDQDQDQEQQQDQQQDQKEGEEQQQQPQPNQLSHEDAQEMLEALQKEEEDVQDKVKKKQTRVMQVEIEQDW